MALSNVVKIFKNLPKFSSHFLNRASQNIIPAPNVFANKFSTPAPPSVQDILMQFFDEKKNWGEMEIRVGRSWTLDELRIKSNTDLHVLWYVLLKERNMLFTMEHECKRAFELFPNPERIDKVEESMKNLESVVRERNTAYHLLETGETGERPSKLLPNQLGIRYKYRSAEHFIPKFMNTKWRETYIHRYGGFAVHKFLRFFREKLYNEKRKSRNRNFNHVVSLMKRFPNLDMEKVKADYPQVDLSRAMKSKKSRGHYIPKDFQ